MGVLGYKSDMEHAEKMAGDWSGYNATVKKDVMNERFRYLACKHVLITRDGKYHGFPQNATVETNSGSRIIPKSMLILGELRGKKQLTGYECKLLPRTDLEVLGDENAHEEIQGKTLIAKEEKRKKGIDCNGSETIIDYVTVELKHKDKEFAAKAHWEIKKSLLCRGRKSYRYSAPKASTQKFSNDY